MGLPDPRHDLRECTLCDMPEPAGGITALPNVCPAREGELGADEIESIVHAVTDAVMASLGKG
jgi:hypothetical protein